jgi:hypothetical protein
MRRSLTSIGVTIAMLTTTLAETPVRIKPEMLLHCVRPQYPYEARSRQIQGSGLFLLSINTKTGLVTKVRKIQSTGSAILDNAFTAAVGIGDLSQIHPRKCWFQSRSLCVGMGLQP